MTRVEVGKEKGDRRENKVEGKRLDQRQGDGRRENIKKGGNRN